MSRTIELTPRLRMVADLLPRDVLLADVGTDHAYLPAALLLEGKIRGAIAADLRPGPLSRARATVEEFGLEGRVKFCLCDGLAGISPGEAGAVAIAGMGGETIASILAAAPWTRDMGTPLVLQPMSSLPDLRLWLQKNGFEILREELAREGETIYTAMLVRAGEMPALTTGELEAGRLDHDPLRGLLLDKLMAKTQRAAEGLERSRQEGSAARREELLALLAELKQMKKEWETWQQ